MKAYLDLLKYIIDNGEEKNDRTNTGTISSFGHQLEFDLEDGFPAVTTKSLAWKGVVSELLWFLEGSDDERRLAEIRFIIEFFRQPDAHLGYIAFDFISMGQVLCIPMIIMGFFILMYSRKNIWKHI